MKLFFRGGARYIAGIDLPHIPLLLSGVADIVEPVEKKGWDVEAAWDVETPQDRPPFPTPPGYNAVAMGRRLTDATIEIPAEVVWVYSLDRETEAEPQSPPLPGEPPPEPTKGASIWAPVSLALLAGSAAFLAWLGWRS